MLNGSKITAYRHLIYPCTNVVVLDNIVNECWRSFLAN